MTAAPCPHRRRRHPIAGLFVLLLLVLLSPPQAGAQDMPSLLDEPVSQVVAARSGEYTCALTTAARRRRRARWTPPPELTDVEWFCDPQGEATCTAAGHGAIDDGLDLPANGRLDYLIEATLPVPSPATIPSQASVAAGPGQIDPDPSDDSAAWTIAVPGIFRDGLEDRP